MSRDIKGKSIQDGIPTPDNSVEIKNIISDLEYCDGVFDYTLTPDYCGLLLGYIREHQQENQKKLHTSNGNVFTKYELLDDYERVLQENQQLKERLKHHNEIVEYSYDLMLQKDKYKSVLDEIRKILDKVNSEHNSENV